MKALQESKALGPDGYTIKFYIAFMNQQAPVLLRLYNEFLNLWKLPPTLYQATIFLIHKEGKDYKSFCAYRPISLLNVDVIILAKIMGNRLETVVSWIVHKDQNNFIKNRELSHNLRQLLT